MRTIAVCFAVAMLLAPVIAAQSRGWEADIPFSFYAGDQQMPAGKYRVASVTEGGWYMRVWALRTAAPAPSARFLQVSAKIDYDRKQSDPLFVFNKYAEDRVFFAGVTSPGETGFNVTKSRSERELITSRVVAQAQPVVVVVAATRQR